MALVIDYRLSYCVHNYGIYDFGFSRTEFTAKSLTAIAAR